MNNVQRGIALVLFAFFALSFMAEEAGAQKDPIKAELQIARRVYSSKLDSAKATFLKAFDDEMKRVAQKGNLDGYKALMADKEAVKRGTKLPDSNPMRKHQMAFLDKALKAKKSLAEALDAAVKQYTMNLEIDNATKVQNEWKALLRTNRSNELWPVARQAPAETPERSKILALKKAHLVREGGSEDTESAVRAALEWLYRHQDADGGWKAAGFNNASVRERLGPSSNKDPKRYPKDIGRMENDVGVTGLAILAFTGFGLTHMDGEYDHFVDCLNKAVGYLLKQQIVKTGSPDRDGCYGGFDSLHWIYNHAIATMAMAELLLMSKDSRLKRSVEEATKICLRAQNDGTVGLRGWRYGVKPGDNDTSVTGWMFLALKTAEQCGLGVPKQEFQNAFDGALKWFEYATASNGKTGYNVPGDEGSRVSKYVRGFFPDPHPFSKDLSCTSAVGVFCRLFAGQSRKDESIRSGVEILSLQLPMWREVLGRQFSTINMYYWYYGTYAMLQFGGKPWQIWNQKMQRVLVDTQRAEQKGDSLEVDGSWDPIGEWGIVGGRIYSTALGARTLEVYYRYQRTAAPQRRSRIKRK